MIMVLKVGVAGGLGRMGSLLIQEVLSHKGDILLSSVEARDPHRLQQNLPRECDAKVVESPKDLVRLSDVILDFTAPELSLRYAHYAVEHQKKLVIGTTGFSEQQTQTLQEASTQTPILMASNTSLGIALVGTLLPQIKKALGPDFDLEIHEAHHRHKKDAPSGTALTLAQKLFPDQAPSWTMISPDCDSSRKSQDIGISVSRAGGIIGDHQVSFVSESEMITISHRALDRRLFATGAVKAALWLAQQEAGLYAIEDVLF